MVDQITVLQSSTISHSSASWRIQLPAYSGVGRNMFAFLVFELLGANLDLSLPTSDCILILWRFSLFSKPGSQIGVNCNLHGQKVILVRSSHLRFR